MKLMQGDCLELMKNITDGSIDMILCDLPYGTTKNRWDSVIPFEPLWQQYKRIIKDNGAIVLFGQGLFFADLIISNRKMYKYDFSWNKVLTSGFLNANKMPLRQHELIAVFYKKLPTYNPQKTVGNKNHSLKSRKNEGTNYNGYDTVDNSERLGNMKHPTSVLTFSKPHSSVCKHPTEKPVALLEYLIKTYTNEGDTVLDNCMGSGSTGVAAVNTGRNFIGMELDESYFNIAKNRIKESETVRGLM